MNALNNLRRSLRRDRSLPLTALIGKGFQYASALASAPFFLRGCTRVGAGVRTVGRPLVANQGVIEIASGCIFNSSFAPVELRAGAGARIEIGGGTFLNYGVLIGARDRVVIGANAAIGPWSIIADTELPDGEAAIDGRPVMIGDDVWLGGRVIVLPGVRIGNGAAIAAGSIVASDIPERVLAGGNPARVLRRLDGAPGVGASQPDTARRTLEPAFRGTLISDFTIDELAGYLRDSSDGFVTDVVVAPFGQVAQTLLAGAPASAADFAVVWTRPEAAVPSFQRLLSFEPALESAMLGEVDQFCELVLRGAAGFKAVFVPSWTRPPWRRGAGLLDGRPGTGAARALTAMNLRLMDRLAQAPNVYVLDAGRWVPAGGNVIEVSKLWFLGKLAFPRPVLEEAARDIKSALHALRGGGRKLLVLDLDETLWGGTVGGAGWQHLRLGGEDPIGESFVAFQRAIKELTRRGVALGLVGNNEESVALDAIRSHPEMVLREKDFAAWRINRADKARNIIDLARALGIALSAVVLIDDDPIERARVRAALPEVLVPEWPDDKLLYSAMLHSLRCFDAPGLSAEDAGGPQKTLIDKRDREVPAKEAGSIDEWLSGLEMRVKVEPLAAHNLAGAAHLFNKTTQFNLSTRRLTEVELAQWAADERRRFWTVSVADRFGEAGITGIVSVEKDGASARVVDYLLSRRVVGRRIENLMLYVAVETAREMGAAGLGAVLVPTPKNKPCADFWKASGFASKDGLTFEWDLKNRYPAPELVQIEWLK